MRRHLKHILLAIHTAVFTLSATCWSIADANDEDLVEAGDIIQIALPLSALGATFVTDDKEGRWQFAKSFGAGWLTTRGIKLLAGKARPDASNKESYPSGHTFGAFSGAAFIDTRYGHLWGIPAYIAATFVGVSRVIGDKHYSDDVIAGGSIAMFANWAYVTPYEGPVMVTPAMFSNDGFGVQLQVAETSDKSLTSKSYAKSEKSRYPRWHYSLAFGPAFLEKNEITAPAGSGTTFDLANFSKDDDPVTTAGGILEVDLNARHQLWFLVQPFESRDSGSFSTPVSFAGQTFPANTEIFSRYLKYDLAGRWRYNLLPEGPWGAKLGLGIDAQVVEVELATADGAVKSEVNDFVVLPFVHGELSYQFTPKLSGLLYAEGISLSDDMILDTGVTLGYQFDEHWDVSLGYNYYKRQIDIDELRNDISYNMLVASVGYTF